MKKRAFMLVGILLISIVMSACSSNSKSTTKAAGKVKVFHRKTEEKIQEG